MLFVRSFVLLRQVRGHLLVVVRGRLEAPLHYFEPFAPRGVAVLASAMLFFVQFFVATAMVGRLLRWHPHGLPVARRAAAPGGRGPVPGGALPPGHALRYASRNAPACAVLGMLIITARGRGSTANTLRAPRGVVVLTLSINLVFT